MDEICVKMILFTAVLLFPFVFGLNWETEEKTDSRVTLRVKREADDKIAQIKALLREARMDNGVIDLNVIIRKHIDDPIPINDFNISNSGFFTDIRGHFSNVELHGLKGFQLTKIMMNLSKMNLSVEMFIPELRFVGTYDLDGTLTFVQVSGDGNFWMNISGIIMKGFSMFEPTPDGQLRMGDIKLQSEVSDIKLHFENLMGGGTWSKFSNSLLNQLSELILDELKHSLLSELSQFLKDEFNDELLEYLPKGFLNSGSRNIIDSILHQTAKAMRSKGLDPLSMPPHYEKAERKLLFYTTRAELNLTDGILYGLSSLYRKGDVIAILVNNSVILEADFGFDNLVGSYNWNAKLFGLGPEGFLEVNVKSIEGFLRIKQDLTVDSKPELEEFRVNGVRHIWLDIRGLGSWDYVMEMIMNLATNGLKMELADAIAGPVKENIQKEIDALNVTLV